MKKRKQVDLKMMALMVAVAIFIMMAMISNSGVTGFSQYLFDEFCFWAMVLITVCVVILTGNGKDFARGMGYAFVTPKEYSRISIQKAIHAMQYVKGVVYLEAGILTLIGLINLAYNLDDLYAIGPAIGWALGSFLYASIFALLMAVVLSKLERMNIAFMEENEAETVTDEQTMYFKLRGMGLTDREAEVARQMLGGLSNREIAQTLYISETTVKKHITHILEKTGTQTREDFASQMKSL